MNAKELGKEIICGGTQLFRTGGDGRPRNVPDGIIGGLTKRELFAGMAMQGLLANKKAMDTVMNAGCEFQSLPKLLAPHAMLFAEALLAELAKEQP